MKDLHITKTHADALRAHGYTFETANEECNPSKNYKEAEP